MGRAGWYDYVITGIDKINIKHTHTGDENIVAINSANIDGDYIDVNITISNISYEYKNKLIYNSGHLTLKVGNLYSGNSKKSYYFGKYSDNPAHDLVKNESFQIYIPSNQINTSYSTTLRIPAYSVMGGGDIGDSDNLRVKDKNEASSWPYIIYKARFCFSAEDGHTRDSMNSDTMYIHCTYYRTD